ncbi:hypothetical protein AWB94_04925 [Mycolicibacterium canariasense]|nr:hypothetical protein AWB94_04925 [Mycolicibacterium canariasense]
MRRDLIERGRHEVAEDRRIAALARQQRTKDTLLQRAQVTEDLIAEVERLRVLVMDKGLGFDCHPCRLPSEPEFKMPSVWSAELGLPDVGPLWKDYPITKAEFLARQGKWDERGRRLT